MRKTRMRGVTLVGVASLVVGTVLFSGGGAAQAKGGSAGGTSSAELAHARRVAPLNAVANALGDQGRGAYADVYGNLYVDEDAGSVTLYVTDVGRGQQLIGAARAAHPQIDVGLIKVVRSEFAKRTLDAQLQKIMTDGTAGVTAASGQAATHPAGAAQDAIYTASANPDASGITVTGAASKLGVIRSGLRPIDSLRVAGDLTGVSTGIPVSVVAGAAPQPQSWRWNDTTPVIAGDVLIGAARASGRRAGCTSGIAAESTDGRDYILTAAHCFPTGTAVYGEGDATGVYGFTYGNLIGTVESLHDNWDAEAIHPIGYYGAGSNSDEADQPQGEWLAVKGSAYSYNGQTVCQDGARSYYTGYGVPCGIKVVDEDTYYKIKWDDGTTHTIRGVHGYNGNYAGTEGDTGALVFTVTNATDRQARGLDSAGDGYNEYWTEAPDILKAFGMILNPYT